MSRFDEIFDDLIFKAKSAADMAGQKTGEVMEYSKLKYQIKQTQWDIEKCYAKLGAFVYEAKKSEEDFADLIQLAISEIDLLNEKLDSFEQQILACKKVVKCSSCGKENNLSAFYCARCGSSLTEDKAKAEEAMRKAEDEDIQEAVEAVEELQKEEQPKSSGQEE